MRGKGRRCGCWLGPWRENQHHGMRVLVRTIMTCREHGPTHMRTYDEVRDAEDPCGEALGYGVWWVVVDQYLGLCSDCSRPYRDCLDHGCLSSSKKCAK